MHANSKDKTEEDEEVHKMHLAMKKRSRELSLRCKNKAQENGNWASFVFDMEAILQCPKGNKPQFYTRKLNCYNFTIYDFSDGSVCCRTWHEGSAGKGPSEVCTCLLEYFFL